MNHDEVGLIVAEYLDEHHNTPEYRAIINDLSRQGFLCQVEYANDFYRRKVSRIRYTYDAYYLVDILMGIETIDRRINETLTEIRAENEITL